MRQKSDEQPARELGEAIKRLRKERGLTRRELEERTGLSYPFLSEIESGKKTPRPDNLKLIADALDTEVSQLWARAERGYEPTGWVAPRPSYFRESRVASFEEPVMAESIPSPAAAMPAPPEMPSETDLIQLLAVAERLSLSDRALLLAIARRMLA